MLVTSQSQSDPVKVKNDLEDSKKWDTGPKWFKFQESREKVNGTRPKWFDSRNPEKKIKRGHWTLVVEIPGNPEEQKWGPAQVVKSKNPEKLMGNQPKGFILNHPETQCDFGQRN